nr:nitric oxide reductase regulator NorR [Cupriavidus necator H16]
MTPMYPELLTDLVTDLPHAVRLQRLVSGLRTHFRCGAVALLRLEEEHLRPVAVDGLVRDTLGRRFAVSLHPLACRILARRDVTCFHHDSMLPDPYDGLIDEHVGEPLPVHDCMGTSLHLDGRPWGVLTLDALTVGTFDAAAQAELQRLTVIVEAAIRTTRLEAEIRALQLARGKQPDGEGPADDGEIIGQSQAIAGLLHELEVVADTDLPVLLLGETGVGKELFAHRLHRHSRRRGHPLVHVNCAALPESLAESELFGHARGAFSGATGERPGRFERAAGGTLFLDEVGELPLSIQAKLVRTLQNGEIQRLGSDRPRRVNVRVIAATNRNLREHVRDGSFRADLFHRLSVYPIPIPPLRERGNDVLLLAGRFLELNRARLGMRSLPVGRRAGRGVRYRWPGNVRELEHGDQPRRAALRERGADRNDIVTLEAELLDLDGLELPAGSAHHAAEAAIAHPALPTGATLREAVEQTQRACIEQGVRAHDGSWAKAARQLGMDASNLHKLANGLGSK